MQRQHVDSQPPKAHVRPRFTCSHSFSPESPVGGVVVSKRTFHSSAAAGKAFEARLTGHTTLLLSHTTARFQKQQPVPGTLGRDGGKQGTADISATRESNRLLFSTCGGRTAERRKLAKLGRPDPCGGTVSLQPTGAKAVFPIGAETACWVRTNRVAFEPTTKTVGRETTGGAPQRAREMWREKSADRCQQG